MYIHDWMSNLGCKRQEIHAQSTLIQRCQNVSARAKVKRTFPGFENKSLLVITRKFFKLKKTWWFRVVTDGIPSESESALLGVQSLRVKNSGVTDILILTIVSNEKCLHMSHEQIKNYFLFFKFFILKSYKNF